MERYILVGACPDKLGLVRAVADYFFSLEATIIEAAQFSDPDNRRFFTRYEFGPSGVPLPPLDELAERFAPLGESLGMEWSMHDAHAKARILVAVSKEGHCLNDLLYRCDEEDFPAEIVGVVSNHEKFRRKVEGYGLPFYHLPITPETKREQEQKIIDIMAEHRVELLVLARYMQILSDWMCEQVAGKAINIHHSFLPSFKGARPYHQAFDRGVKIMGATAHYVTKDLDEGPIIEQDVQRIEHFHDARTMVQKGKNVETVVLAHAVNWHCLHRVIINGHKTVIFK